MLTPDDIRAALTLLAGCLALGAVGCWAFGAAGLPGGRRAAGLVGGIVVGLLAGPGGLGVLAGDRLSDLLEGGVTQREALVAYDAQTDAHIAAIRITGVTDVAVEEHAAQRATQRVDLEDALAQAQSDRRNAIDAALFTTLGLFIAAAAPYWFPRDRGQRSRNGFAVFLGIILTAALASTLLRATSPTLPLWTVMTVGAVAACACPSLSARAKGPLSAWAFIGFFACFTLARLTAELVPDQREGLTAIGYATGTALLLLALGGLILMTRPRAQQRAARKLFASVAYRLLLPGVVALTVLRIDAPALWGDWLFWSVLIVSGAVSSDLRWYAIARLMRAAGRNAPYLDAERCANAGGGIAQLIVVLALQQTGAINDALTLALIVGGTVGEMTVTFRARLALAMHRGVPLSTLMDQDTDHPDG